MKEVVVAGTVNIALEVQVQINARRLVREKLFMTDMERLAGVVGLQLNSR